MALAEYIAEYVHRIDLDDFDANVVEYAKDLCISSIGSTILGASMDVPRRLADQVRATGASSEASLVGFGFASSADLAAMVNCTASHCTEFEDVAWPEAQYTCCLIPALFSLGDVLDASGRDVLQAIIVGFEVAARPGMICSNHGAAVRGFLSCANNGTIGVAAGAAKLMRLPQDQIRDAITLSASMTGGLVRQTGSAAHVLEAGLTARDGITAAMLAARGLGGNPSILDGRAGFFDALAGQPDIAFELGRGADLRILSVGQKKYPCCYLLQRNIDAVRSLVTAHDIAPDEVAEIRVEVNGAYPTIVKYPDPQDVEEARFSLHHVIAATLVGEPMDARTFSADKLHEPAIRRHYDKVRMIVNDAWGYDQLGERDLITITLSDGALHEAVCTVAHGDAKDRLTREETIAKFHTCVGEALDRPAQNATTDALAALETLPSVRPLMKRLEYLPIT